MKKQSLLICLAVALAWSLPGCLGGGPPRFTEKFMLEYPSPRFNNRTGLHAVIRVERFGVAQAYNSTAMVYRPKPYQLDEYRYHRWQANPGDMITDYLLRDLRESGLFRAVYSYREDEGARFLLQGGVMKILEENTDGPALASVAVHVTLLDLTQHEVTRRVLLDRTYERTEPFQQAAALGFAMGASRAAQEISRQAIEDVYGAIKEALQ